MGKQTCIYVLAGTNGAGKSSVLGEMLLKSGISYFNPDVATQQILARNPEISPMQANGLAWNEGKHLLEKAIAESLDLAFETTLGGNTITSLLERALVSGKEVRIWYVGLNSPELHLTRIRMRVAGGGHDIPEEKVRIRYLQSIVNLCRLLPLLTELRVYDNSSIADPATGRRPRPTLLIHCRDGRIEHSLVLAKVPSWAEPIFAVAMKQKRAK